jgi:hypothetical protein
MATFIPEWNSALGRDLQIRRVLGALDDAYCIRRPLRPGGCAVDMFVQHPAHGWMAIAVSTTPFSALDPAQLFESAEQEDFERRVAQWQGLADMAPPAGQPLGVLAIMWVCTTDEVQALASVVVSRPNVRLVSREQFSQFGLALVQERMSAVPEHVAQHLMSTYFPEAEIPPACTTRHFAGRDNRARLGRLFLDHEQEWAAKLDLDLPAEQQTAAADLSVRLVNGVAGSGKTLIAISRARLLAELFPRQRILVLIHNTPIVADLMFKLRQAGVTLPANLQMLTFFAWIRRQWRCAFKAFPSILDDPHEVLGLLRHHRMRWPELKVPEAQVLDEFDFINDALIVDEAAYLAARRSGRRFALRPAERSQVWALRRAFNRSLLVAGQQIWSDLPRKICLTPACHPALVRYHHVLVDEAQFFAPSWFDAVKLSLAPNGQLFLCADPNQGFLKNRLSWKGAGLAVAGRTKRLRRSYRTTRSILEAATAVQAMLAAGPAEDGLEPDVTGMDEGHRPQLVYADTTQDAIDRLANELQAQAGEIPLGAFLVIYGDHTIKGALYTQLQRRFGARRVWWFNEHSQKKEPPGGDDGDYLRLANLETATGLEGRVVFLIGVDRLFRPVDGVIISDAEAADRREDNARRLYMAMTRAAQRLVVIACERLPPEIEALFDHAGP